MPEGCGCTSQAQPVSDSSRASSGMGNLPGIGLSCGSARRSGSALSPEAVKYNIHITWWLSGLTARKLPPGFTGPHPGCHLLPAPATPLIPLKKGGPERAGSGSSLGERGRSPCSWQLVAQGGQSGFGEVLVFSCHRPHPFLVELGIDVRILLGAGTLQQHPLRRDLGSAAW